MSPGHVTVPKWFSKVGFLELGIMTSIEMNQTKAMQRQKWRENHFKCNSSSANS